MRFKYIVQSLILFLTLNMSVSVFAQLVVDEGSFKEVDGFVNINTEKMYDDNDRAYAVLKVKTENINDRERHKLLFEGDARTFFELEYKPGEVWVYISYYATYLKISHPDFGSTEFWFPFDMQGKKGYELTIINKPSVDQEFADRLSRIEEAMAVGGVSGDYGYIVIQTTPVGGATVIIDGIEMDEKTPFISTQLGPGPHRVRVEKEFYKPYVTVVNIEDGKSVNLDVVLNKAVGSLEIKSYPKNATIKIGRDDKGSTPKVFNNIPAGNYKIELSRRKYETAIRDVTVRDGENTLVEVDMERVKSLRKKGWVFRPEIRAGVNNNISGVSDGDYVKFVRFNIDNAGGVWDNKYLNGTSVKMPNFNNPLSLGIAANMGYQLNPFVYMGLGLGIDANYLSPIISMPLYVNPRIYLNNAKRSFYIDMKVGTSISIKASKLEPEALQLYDGYYYSDGSFLWSYNGYKDFVSIEYVYKVKGLSTAFEIGIEYKHSSFGIVLNYQKIYCEHVYNNHYYYFGDTNLHSNSEVPNYNNDNYVESESKMFYTVMFKYGYSIFMK